MDRDAIDFENGKVSTLFRKLFIPTLIGSLSISAMTAIDGIFVGHGIGSDGVAAINIAAPVWMVFAGLGIMMGVGCSVVTAIHLSHKKLKVARLNVSQSLLFSFILTTIICSVVMVFPKETARLLGSSPHLEGMVSDYLLGLMPCFVFDMWTMTGLFVIRLDGSPRMAMWCNAICSICNIVLDWLMIIHLQWGVLGAAIASTISVVVGGTMTLIYLFGYARTLRPIAIKMSRKSLMLSLRNVGYHCRIGSSSLLGETTLAFLVFIGNHVFMEYLGDEGVGAFGVACYYTPFIFMVGNSIAQSAQPIISYNYGIQRFDYVREALRLLIVTALVCGLMVTAVFALFPKELVGLFLDPESPAARLAIQGFPLFAFGFIPFIINISIIGYLQSIERVKLSTSFSLLRGVIFLLPCFYFLPMFGDVPGIWLSMSATELLTLAVIFCFVFWRKVLVQHTSSK